MRIQQIMIVPLAALGLVAGHAAQDDGDAAAANAALQTRVVALEARLGQTEAYLQAQAKAAADLDKQIQVSVEEGFTSGINFRSREILVAAWSARNKATGQGVPGAKPEKTEKAEAEPPQGR